MKVTVLLRPNDGITNDRCRAVGEGLASRCKVNYSTRSDWLQEQPDLLVQAGFHATLPLREQLEQRRPFLIIEEPLWRPNPEFSQVAASFGYNGLTGGDWHPPSPEHERPHPLLMPMKGMGDGACVVFGQKPNDHSLRGSDHVAWLKAKLAAFPEAEFRHHPLMCAHTQEPLDDVLDRSSVAITYSSTVGAEALIAGCVSNPNCRQSTAYNVTDREQWIHDLSWHNFTLEEFATPKVAKYILSGFQEAWARCQNDNVERPRGRVNKQEIMMRYYSEFGN